MVKDQGIGITIFSPLFRGLLGIDAFHPEKRPMNAESRKLFEKYRDQAEQYSKLCRELGETEANVTFAWELSRPEITSVIVAPTCIEDLSSVLKSVDIVLQEDVLRKIDSIFPPTVEASPYI